MAASVSSTSGWGRRGGAIGVGVALAVFVAGLAWAKWSQYAAKAFALRRHHHWRGSNILTTGGVRAGDRPTWHAATTFFHAYLSSIWPALVISASAQALVPRTWFPRLFNRRRVLSSAFAGATVLSLV